MDIFQQIAELEEKIRTTPYHKGTEHQIGRWRARIARLKEEILEKETKKRGGGKSFGVRKSGDATVVLVGPPSVGKSSLINCLTSAESRVGSYDFTTLTTIPGMMEYQGAKIQILDLPGLISGAAKGKGRGKEVLSNVRMADLILLVVDINRLGMIEQIKKELYEFGVLLDQTPPLVTIKKTNRGGTKITSTTPLTYLNLKTVQELASEFRIHNGEIIIKEDITLERLIDAFLGNRVYLPYLVVVNKVDLLNESNNLGLPSSFILVSALKHQGIEELKSAIWKKLELLRVYLKPPEKEPDFSSPVIIKKGENLKAILEKITPTKKELICKAKIFGPGAKFPGQEVSLEFQPQDGTIVSFLGG